jgi:hypothetical protein
LLAGSQCLLRLLLLLLGGCHTRHEHVRMRQRQPWCNLLLLLLEWYKAARSLHAGLCSLLLLLLLVLANTGCL